MTTARLQEQDRRNDTRDKIELGSIVVKAGLRHADKAFLLGVLIEASRLAAGSADYQHLKEIGDAALAKMRPGTDRA